MAFTLKDLQIFHYRFFLSNCWDVAVENVLDETCSSVAGYFLKFGIKTADIVRPIYQPKVSIKLCKVIISISVGVGAVFEFASIAETG
jgi:hypothetical protein